MQIRAMCARVAELVDALDLGSSTFIGVGVRVPPLVLIRSYNIQTIKKGKNKWTYLFRTLPR